MTMGSSASGLAGGSHEGLGPAGASEPGNASLASAQFTAFYRKEFVNLVQFMIWSGASREDAADVTQAAMTKAWSHWRDIDNPAGWVRTVAMRDWHRKIAQDRRTRPVDSRLLVDTIEETPQTTPLDDVVEARLAREAVDDLPKTQRAALELFADGYTPSEIAEMIGASPMTVRTHLHRARKALKARLSDR